MAERTVDINLRNTNEVPSNVPPAELQEYLKHLQVHILDRGGAHDRFELKAESISEGELDGLHYEWHPLNAWSLSRLSNLGFTQNDALAEKGAQFINRDGTGRPMIADTYLWTIPKWKKQLIDRFEAEKALAKEDPRRASKDFAATIQDKFVSVPTSTTGPDEVKVVSGTEVLAATNQA